MASSMSGFDLGGGRVAAPLPWHSALYYAVAAYLLYYFNTAINCFRYLKEAFFFSDNSPTVVRSYACRPRLPLRIFIPESHSRSPNHKLSTLFTIHGGGFVLGNARDVDPWNRAFANTHSVLVISLNYSKSPIKRFPVPIYDIEQVILAVLTDFSLPIDQNRVAIAGFSAGGNLALSVSALPSMCGSGDGIRRIQAAIPIYPVVDMSVHRNHKMQTRRYKPSIGGFRAKASDYLLPLSQIFNWAYTPRSQDLKDPLLSPLFTPRDRLPPSVFIIGCELDMLAGEAWRMICNLTDHPIGDERVGRDQEGPMGKLILDDERYSFEVRNQHGRYKWLLIPDQIHGFDQCRQLQLFLRDQHLAIDAERKTKECQRLISEWLFSGPFAVSK